jgi:hypothetical protein
MPWYSQKDPEKSRFFIKFRLENGKTRQKSAEKCDLF